MVYGLGQTEFDHEIKIGSTTMRLQVFRDADGKLNDRLDETISTYQDPYRVIMTDWSDGHGQYNFREGSMFLEGQSIDTTQEGRVILGPLITEVQESDDTVLDSSPLHFVWFQAASKWLCAIKLITSLVSAPSAASDSPARP